MASSSVCNVCVGTSIYFKDLLFTAVTGMPVLAVGKVRNCIMRKVKCGMKNAES